LQAITLHDKARIEQFLRRDPFRNLYMLGDLDDFFWKHSTWYGLHRDDPSSPDAPLEGIVQIYTALPEAIMLAFEGDDPAPMCELMRRVLPYLPRTIYAHLTPSLVEIVSQEYTVESHGLHLKMAFTDPAKLDDVELDNVERSAVLPIRVEDGADVKRFFDAVYPGNWFDPRMLETGQYFGIKNGAEWVSVAGVHTYSPVVRVAALGNITTHPAYRGRGYARAVTAATCRSLMQTTDHIGLNVKADNSTAISVYRKLGFEPVAEYTEYTLRGK
jgi:ribosomal protein S18 acetylase RimI-like enzyme